MNQFTVLGAGIGITLYLVLVWQIVRDGIVQNIATFLLWAVLDTIAAISSFYGGGNWVLPAAYAVGGVLICAALLVRRSIKWTWFETFISCLVVICLIGWWLTGDRFAILLSTIGVALAAGPQTVDAYKEPKLQPLGIYSGFFIANGLSVFGGTEWSLEQRLYPTVCVILTALLVLPLIVHRIRNRIPVREWF